MDPTFGQSISPFGGGDGYSHQAQTSALDMDTSRPMDTFDAFHSKQGYICLSVFLFYNYDRRDIK